MPNGTLTEYLGKNPGANRVDIVSLSPMTTALLVPFFLQAIGRSGRSGLSSCEARHTWRFERSGCLLSAAFVRINDLLPAQHSRRPRWSCPLGRFRLCLRCSRVELSPCIQCKGVYTGVGCTRSDQGKFCEYEGGGCLCFRHSCDRGQSLAFLCQTLGVEGLMVCLLLCLLKVFTGSRPFSELAPPDAVFRMVMNRELPDRPREQDLTDPVWDMTVQCWHHNPDSRPKMTQVVATLREWQVFLSLEHEHCDMMCFYFL